MSIWTDEGVSYRLFVSGGSTYDFDEDELEDLKDWVKDWPEEKKKSSILYKIEKESTNLNDFLKRY